MIHNGGNITFYYDKQVAPPTPEVGPAPGDTNLNFKLCYDPSSPSATVNVSIGGQSELSVPLSSGVAADGLFNCLLSWEYVYRPSSINVPNNSNDSIVLNVTGGTLLLENLTIIGTN